MPPKAAATLTIDKPLDEAWPVIVTRKDPLPGADGLDGEPGKLEKYFSEAPGLGG